MENKNIAYLGPKATFAHEAALRYFNENNTFIPFDRIDEVFRKVINSEANFGVVPAENSIGGTVADTIDLFVETNVKIYDQITLEIKQSLLSKTTRDKITKIYSHPQSFYQCSKYIFNYFPKAEYIETTSNAKAALMASNESNSAAIGPALCAVEYGLNVIDEAVNDFKHNETKFFIIAKEIQEKIKAKSMIIFSVPNKSGSLFNVLKIFKNNKINMTRIESRPSKIKKWDYVFIIEFENNQDEKKVKNLIEKLKSKCEYFNYLGSY